MAVEAVVLKETLRESFEIPAHRLAGRVDVCSLSLLTEHGKDRHRKGEGQPVHDRISLIGPVPESNLAAIFSDIL